MRARKLTIGICAAAVTAAFVPAAHADEVIVCNEAEKSWRGGYVVNGDLVDPNPPARLLGSTMRVGRGKGLVNAAAHSPALRTCGPEDGDGGGDDDGGISDS